MSALKLQTDKLQETIQIMVELQIDTNNKAECLRNLGTLMGHAYILETHIKETILEVSQNGVG